MNKPSTDNPTAIPTAIDYIKKSHLFSDKKNVWIEPLLQQVLDNEFDDGALEAVLLPLIRVEEKTDEPIDKTVEETTGIEAEAAPQEQPAKPVVIKHIVSIEDISNIGLLTRHEPISLRSGLNVFYGDSHVIRDVAFELAAGETIAIMGRNGMGKTTLLKALIGLQPARSGQVRLEGRELNGARTYERVARGMGFVPQGRMIFPYLTVEENVLTGMELSLIHI